MPSLTDRDRRHRRACRLALSGGFLLAMGLGLGACESPTPPESDAERAAATAPYPNLNSVPKPPAAMTAEMRRREAERLAADRTAAQTADQGLRPSPGTAAAALPTSWGRQVAALRPAGAPPRLGPDQRADLAQVAQLVRGRAGRVRLVHAVSPTSDAAAATVASELTALGVPPARIVDQPVRQRPRVAGAEPAPVPPPEGEIQIYVD